MPKRKRPVRIVPGQMAFTVPQAAVALGVSERTVRRLIQAGALRAAKVFKRTIISREAIEEFLESGGAMWLSTGLPYRGRKTGRGNRPVA